MYMSLFEKLEVRSQGGLGNLNVAQVLLKMEVLLQIVSYIGAGSLLLCGLPQGQFIP